MFSIIEELAGKGLKLLASLISKKGVEYVSKLTGINLQDKELDTDTILDLKKFEMDNELELMRLALKSDELFVSDKDSARSLSRDIQKVESSFLAKNTSYFLDLIVVFLAIVLTTLLFFTEIPGNNKQLFYMAYGAVLTWVGTIISFYRGSSKGSRDKDLHLKLEALKNAKL